jgi:hypothetical protein
MKKNQPASLQKMNLDLHFPMWIQISRNKLYHLISQSELNDSEQNLNRPKIQAEHLAYRLRGWKLLQQDVKMSYMKRQQTLSSFFMDGKLVYCNDMEGLPQELGCTRNPEELRHLWICLNLV